MSQAILNLTLRFLLEMAALAALGYWGWTQHSGLARWLWTIGLPFAAAFVWGTFRIGERGLVAIPSPLRLLLEFVFFGGAVLALVTADRGNAAGVLGMLLLLHSVLSYDYVIALLRNRPLRL